MSISTRCQCGASYDVPESFAGKKIKCKACGQGINVPDAVPISIAIDDDDDDSVEPAVSAPPLPRRQFTPVSVTSEEILVAPPSSTRSSRLHDDQVDRLPWYYALTKFNAILLLLLSVLLICGGFVAASNAVDRAQRLGSSEAESLAIYTAYPWWVAAGSFVVSGAFLLMVHDGCRSARRSAR